MDSIKLLKLGAKAGFALLMVLTIAFAGLFLTIKPASAVEPSLTVLYLGTNNDDPADPWDHDVTLNSGQTIKFYAEIHNVQTGSVANNLKIQASLPGGNGTSVATVSADNTASKTDSVNITINGGGTLQYVSGSTEVNCHSNAQCTNGNVGDGIVGGGINLGNQNGCNEFIIQVSWKAKVVSPEASPSPSPSPSPTPTVVPSPSPSPATGGNIVNNNTNVNNNNNNVEVKVEQENKQEQNQTVNVTGAGATLGAKVPVKQPETGVGVLGLASMFSAAPLGIALSRYGRGRVISNKKEEELSEVANDLVKDRQGKRA